MAKIIIIGDGPEKSELFASLSDMMPVKFRASNKSAAAKENLYANFFEMILFRIEREDASRHHWRFLGRMTDKFGKNQIADGWYDSCDKNGYIILRDKM